MAYPILAEFGGRAMLVVWPGSMANNRLDEGACNLVPVVLAVRDP